ncbi:MAG: polysaccharide deacetylase family protein [Deltaproteobacteria bacterium]|nr:polysaccharide deacetylase family protein [Deltaproteobacteria bacterium]
MVTVVAFSLVACPSADEPRDEALLDAALPPSSAPADAAFLPERRDDSGDTGVEEITEAGTSADAHEVTDAVAEIGDGGTEERGRLMIEPKSGSYPYRTAITLTAEDQFSEIRYTLDGTTPDRESLVYTAPLVMSQPVGTSLVVRAIAFQSDGKRSAEIRGDYTIEPGLVIHFRKPADWSSPSFYFWDPRPGPLTTLWPGIAMLPENASDAEGWYYATLKGQVEANFLFNGNDRPQTEDIYWSKQEGWFDEWEWMDISPEAMRRYTTCCLFPNARPKALIMSFDDGREQDARLIEIFDRYGIKGSFHLNSGSLGARDIAAAYEGHEVSSHSVHHPYLNDLTRAQLEAEVLQDRLNLEALVGYPVRGMAYPFGSYNTTLLRSMNDFGLVYGRVVPTTKDFRLPYDLLRWRGTCHHSEASGLVDAFWATPQLTWRSSSSGVIAGSSTATKPTTVGRTSRRWLTACQGDTTTSGTHP